MTQTFTLPRSLPRQMRRDGMIERICRFLTDLDPSKPWRITVAQAKSTRSDPQNNYLWGVAYKLLSEHTGYEPEEIHEVLLGKHFGEREKRVPKCHNFPNGVKLVPRRTTTTNEEGKRDVLTWDVFMDYVAFVQRTGAKVGCFIPDPDPDYAQHREKAA